MSLDIYLMSKPSTRSCKCAECGNVHLTRKKDLLGELNITHNLVKMAREAYIYTTIWRPTELFDHPSASDIVPLLRSGLEYLLLNKERLNRYSDPSGWGTHDQFVEFVREYIRMCEKYPEALIEALS